MRRNMGIRVKWVICQLAVSGSLFLSACGAYAKETQGDAALTAGETMQIVMESMQTLDLDQFNAYTDNYIQTQYHWSGLPVGSQYRVFNELLHPGIKLGKRKEKYAFHHKLYEEIMENLTWEIICVEEGEEQATIVMEVTNLDMDGVMEKYESDLLEKLFAGAEGGIKELAGAVSDIADADGSLLALIESWDPEAACTFEVEATANRKNGAWIIHLDDALLNACMGNIK